MDAATHAGASLPSPELLAFTNALPYERRSILEFAQRVAAEVPAGCRLLDVGAGNSPYRELFSHVRYESHDWQHSLHPGARAVDHVGPADAIPVEDGAFDAVLCTQVLEHVPDPAAVLAELHRVLVSGGRLYLTLPLAWELHELPFDFFRYTPHGLYHLLSDAGYGDIDVRPRNDCFSTLAQLLDQVGHIAGRYPDGQDGRREQAAHALREMSEVVAGFADLDVRHVFPLGYSVAARAQAADDSPASPRRLDPARRDALGLGHARSFLTLCFASEALSDRQLLADYFRHVRADDDASLVIYAPNCEPSAALARLRALLESVAPSPQDRPSVIALATQGSVDESELAAATDAVLSLTPPSGPFAGTRWTHTGSVAALHAVIQDRLRHVEVAAL